MLRPGVGARSHVPLMDVRVRALETLLVHKGYVDPAALDYEDGMTHVKEDVERAKKLLDDAGLNVRGQLGIAHDVHEQHVSHLWPWLFLVGWGYPVVAHERNSAG